MAWPLSGPYAAAQGHPRLRGAGSEARPVASPALCELPQVQAIVEQLCDDKMKNVSVRRPLCDGHART